MKTIINIFFCSLFLLVPIGSEARVSVIGRLSHERTVEIGKNYKGTIFIRNDGDVPEEVRVYQTDYLFFFDGRNLYGEPGKTSRSNAVWITFSPHRLIVPAKGRSAVNYTIKVPDDESLIGTYWSMMMVEGMGKPYEAKEGEKSKVNLGIRQVMRFGVQMVTHIGDTGALKLKFLKTELLKKEERIILQIDAENNGERWLRPFIWAELYDEKGSYIGRFEGGRLRIYPGTSVRYRVDLSQVPEGKYRALVVADSGNEYVVGAQYTLFF